MRMLFALVLAIGVAASARAHGQQLPAVDAARAELRKREATRAELDQERARLAVHSQELVAAVDREKREPAGVRHDLRLGDLLAAAKAESDKLEAVAVELRRRSTSVSDGRRALVVACDRALATELGAARRLELARLRTAQVTLLAQVGSQGKVVSGVDVDPLDGPRELLEKADLLRDSGDKLRREVQRMALRIDDAERRRHLRERAYAVDEDLFGDATYSRRTAQPSRSATVSERGAADNAPAAATPSPSFAGGTGGVTANPSPSASEPAVVLRNLVDPTTLEELRRADGSEDFDRQVRALRRAQTELEGLARELDQRAQTLSSKAATLRNQK